MIICKQYFMLPWPYHCLGTYYLFLACRCSRHPRVEDIIYQILPKVYVRKKWGKHAPFITRIFFSEQLIHTLLLKEKNWIFVNFHWICFSPVSWMKVEETNKFFTGYAQREITCSIHDEIKNGFVEQLLHCLISMYKRLNTAKKFFSISLFSKVAMATAK